MARKVILDVDPGIDDAVALCSALFDPRLQVVAVTAVGGNVSPEQATRNVHALVEQLDPPRWPRIGAALEPEHGLPTDNRHIFGADGLGNANFPYVEPHHQHPADKVIADEIRSAPDEITLVALGPLTNIAAAFRRDPMLAAQLGRLVIMGGAVRVPGDITPAAQFNIYSDPEAAREVFRSATTKTLIPLDVTGQIVMAFDLLNSLPEDHTRAGQVLHKILPFAFRSYRERLGVEGIHLHDAVALTAVTNPELFEMREMAADVETTGELTRGATVFDRRAQREWRMNMEVAMEVDAAAVMDNIIRTLRYAGEVD